MATAKDRAPTKSKLQTNALGFQPWANMLAVDIVRTAGQVRPCSRIGFQKQAKIISSQCSTRTLRSVTPPPVAAATSSSRTPPNLGKAGDTVLLDPAAYNDNLSEMACQAEQGTDPSQRTQQHTYRGQSSPCMDGDDDARQSAVEPATKPMQNVTIPSIWGPITFQISADARWGARTPEPPHADPRLPAEDPGLPNISNNSLAVEDQITQQGVDADNSINDSWSELLELPKDPKMLHSVKDVRSPTLWTGLRRLVKPSKKQQIALTVDTRLPPAQTMTSSAPRKVRGARIASALQKVVRKAGCCMRPRVHEECLPPADLGTVPAMESSVPAELGSKAAPLTQEAPSDLGTVPAMESSVPAELGGKAAPLAQCGPPADDIGSPQDPVHDQDEPQGKGTISMMAQLEETQAMIQEQEKQLTAQSTIIRRQTISMVQMKRTVDQLTCSLSSCQEDLQAAQGHKARLEAALVKSGPLLKQVVAQRDHLLLNMKKLVAADVTKNLENVYAPLLEAYKQRCRYLEDQLEAHGLSARHTPAQSRPTPLSHWQPVPEHEVQAVQGPPQGFVPEVPSTTQDLPSACNPAAPPAQQSLPRLPDSIFGYRACTGEPAAPAAVHLCNSTDCRQPQDNTSLQAEEGLDAAGGVYVFGMDRDD